MGIVLYGDGVTQIKGKVGGVVHQKMGSSLGVRRHIVPSMSQSQSLLQSNIHTNNVATVWKSLSNAQKSAWNNVAPGYPSTNRYGIDFTLNGYQLFYKINKRMALFDAPFIIVPAAYLIITTAIVDVANIDYSGHTFNVTYPSYTYGSLYFMYYLSKFRPYTVSDRNIKFYKGFDTFGIPSSVVNHWSYLPPYWQNDPGPDLNFVMNAIVVEVAHGRYGLYGTVYDGQQ